jgi:hypothetical protein
MTVEDLAVHIAQIQTQEELDIIFRAYKNRWDALNVRDAVHFRLNQKVKFRDKGEVWEGTVDTIRNNGKIKVKLISSRYSHYNLGAHFLLNNLIKE